jgi:2-methylisocitrate lyase-like PEP mutase family enzyme
LHHRDVPLLLPNAWDFASAAALTQAGFTAIGTTSMGVAGAHGLPDARGLGRAQTVALAGLLRRLPCLLTVDVEAGFSTDPAEVAALAVELADLGVVGLNLEDGRPDGTLADPGRQAELVSAIEDATPDLYLNARTDAFWCGVPNPLAVAVERAHRYLDAGADGVFVPAAADASDVRTLVREIPAPLNLLHLPGRHTLAQLADLGVRRVSTGSLLFRAAVHAVTSTALAVRDDSPLPADPPSYAAVAALLDC